MPSIGSLCVCSFYIHSFLYLTTTLLKSDVFSGTQKPTPPTVFNLQALDLVYCEEETGSYYQLSRFTYKFVIFFYTFLTLFILPKKYLLFKKFPKFIVNFFFFKKIIGHTYICINAMITSNLLYL